MSKLHLILEFIVIGFGLFSIFVAWCVVTARKGITQVTSSDVYAKMDQKVWRARHTSEKKARDWMNKHSAKKAREPITIDCEVTSKN